MLHGVGGYAEQDENMADEWFGKEVIPAFR
jgi:hypothetical protein